MCRQYYRNMAITNTTGDVAERDSYEELVCSTEIDGGIHNQLIALSVINCFLCITAFLGNTLILVVLHKESSIHPPSKYLFRSLAATDLCVGIIAEPLYVAHFVTALIERRSICRYTFVTFLVTSCILGSMSLLLLTAISVDRLLALLLGLRYRHTVTLKRVRLTVALSLAVSIAGSTMYFVTHQITLWYGYSVTSVCILISIFSYAKIFITLRHNQVHAQETRVRQRQPSATVCLSKRRYRKTVFSALLVQLALVICYLPESVMGVLVLQRELSPSLFVVRSFSVTLACLNSSLNPILYYWRISEVRRTIKDTIRGFFCSSS